VSATVRFRFEGRELSGRAGQSIGAALHAAGVTTLGWSAKYRRPRGLRCCAGACPCCQLSVDGLPGVAACVTPLAGGEVVVRMRPRAPWLPVDRVSRLTPAGFYYERLRRAPRAWPYAERVLAALAGVGELPPAGARAVGAYEEVTVDHLVVGAGREGLLRARDLATGGGRVVVADRDHEAGGRLLSEPGGRRRAAALVAAACDAGAELWLRATVIGVWEGGTAGIARGADLVVVHAAGTHPATGSRDRELAFPEGDRPGVLLAGAVRRLLVREEVTPGRLAVVVAADGEGAGIRSLLHDHGIVVAAVCRPAELVSARGRDRVDGVAVRRRGAPVDVPCDTVVIDAGTRPADELARMDRGG
jgi:sarcosine oxidase subunit alpha